MSGSERTSWVCLPDLRTADHGSTFWAKGWLFEVRAYQKTSPEMRTTLSTRLLHMMVRRSCGRVLVWRDNNVVGTASTFQTGRSSGGGRTGTRVMNSGT